MASFTQIRMNIEQRSYDASTQSAEVVVSVRPFIPSSGATGTDVHRMYVVIDGTIYHEDIIELDGAGVFNPSYTWTINISGAPKTLNCTALGGAIYVSCSLQLTISDFMSNSSVSGSTADLNGCVELTPISLSTVEENCAGEIRLQLYGTTLTVSTWAWKTVPSGTTLTYRQAYSETININGDSFTSTDNDNILHQGAHQYGPAYAVDISHCGDYNISAVIELATSAGVVGDTLSGGGIVTIGSVRIYNGSTFDLYECYIDNGTTWDICVPYIDNGSTWDLYS